MRVAIVQAGLGAGGAERVISMIAADRCARGDEVHVLAFESGNVPSYFQLDSRVQVHRLSIDESSRILQIYRRAVGLRRELKAINPNVVLSFLTKINIVTLLATRGLHVPVIISERNNPRMQPRHWLWYPMAAFFTRFTSAMVAQTRAAARDMPKKMQSKTKVIPNPCDPVVETARPTVPKKTSRKIVAVGRLTHQKGFDILIDAFAIAANHRPGWGLSIFGEGPDRAALERQIGRLNLSGRVFLPGVTKTFGTWKEGAEIFVLSSRYEGFPNVLVEAMAAGLPVVATACPYGPDEIIKDRVDGILVPHSSAPSLAGALELLMDNEALRRTLGQRATVSVRPFATSRVMAEWDRLISTVMTKETSSRSLDVKRGHIVIVLPGLDAGGTERVVNILANHWAGEGYEVTLLTLEPQATTPYYTFDPRVKIVNVDLVPRRTSAPHAGWLALRRVIAFRKALKRAKPDVIVSFLMRTNIITLLALLDSPTPIIVSERNNPARQPLGAVWKRFQSALYPRAFGLVTMTKGAMDYFPAPLKRRSWIIPNPVDLPDGQRKAGSGKRLAAVGRLVPQKGFDLLIDAFASIADRHPDWTLVIWGEGPDRNALEDQRGKRGLQERILMPGVSERPGSWLETTDAFVLSSRFEGWGIVLLEAMAWGLPCVSFDCEWGPGEMIENGVDGILVPPEDIPALAQKLSEVMSDPKLRHGLSKAAKQSTRRFSRARVMAAWDEVIQTALAERDGGRRAPS